MSAKSKTGKNSSTRSMLIILIAIIIAGIGITLILNWASGTGKVTLQEGQDYNLTNVVGNEYQVIDDDGNVIKLDRVTPEIFKDVRGRSYRFVSGSPYKYIGKK